jgi:hypothetical protein
MARAGTLRRTTLASGMLAAGAEAALRFPRVERLFWRLPGRDVQQKAASTEAACLQCWRLALVWRIGVKPPAAHVAHGVDNGGLPVCERWH